MPQTVLLIGTLDTKGEELGYVRHLIEERGHNVRLVDLSILDDPVVKPDVSASRVAEEGGHRLEDLRKRADRGKAVQAMIDGLSVLIPKLFRDNQFDAALSIGGGSGTNMASAAMQALPVGVPKMIVSTIASGDVSPYVDVKDVTMMYSVVDIEGLNTISQRILSNAAGAICGMVEQTPPTREGKPLIAASMFGVTTPYVKEVRKRLERIGYEVVVFHATGTGGRAMEGLIRDGYFTGVADLTTTEWCDEIVGGVLSAGPDRLEAAADTGIPQVVSCGALDMVNFLAYDTVPREFRERNLYRYNPNVTLMRTTPDECTEIGRRIADKLNRSQSETSLLLPLRGVSMLDKEGEVFYDPAADEALFDSLRNHLQSDIRVIALDLHINDPAFAEATSEEVIAQSHSL